MVADSSFEEKVKELAQWFETHDSLPELIDDVVLRRFLYSMENDVEEAKKLILHSYSMRTKHSNLFFDRDPIDDKIQKIFEVADLGVPMPNLTACKRRIVINRLIDHDPDKFDFDMIVKAFFLSADMRFSIRDDDLPLKINCGDIPIFDMTGLSYRHLTKLSLSTLRCYMRFTQEGFPVRLKEIHLINVSPVLSKLLTIIKPFMKTRVKNMLNYHEPNSSTFFEFIDQDLMPIEYGGKAGKMSDIKLDFTKQLESRREYLTCPKRWKPRDNNNKIISNVRSTFTDLSID
ncbi:hypothetical protein PVAND_009971 [Polypedilum vanderplanki]|uniref:CRAL-TRIO domain-containing protein n=1 Tax=Polypedilum vanderplanki TaxID=319348 RepID=A0A9J6CEW6_POLVA|nr:hypothetical protein PVAND_009971 [Polypedilum vanderplanki]